MLLTHVNTSSRPIGTNLSSTVGSTACTWPALTQQRSRGVWRNMFRLTVIFCFLSLLFQIMELCRFHFCGQLMLYNCLLWIFYGQFNSNWVGSGSGSVGWAVASDSRSLQFESSHWQKITLNIYCQLYWKDENEEKEAGKGSFNSNTWFTIVEL